MTLPQPRISGGVAGVCEEMRSFITEVEGYGSPVHLTAGIHRGGALGPAGIHGLHCSGRGGICRDDGHGIGGVSHWSRLSKQGK